MINLFNIGDSAELTKQIETFKSEITRSLEFVKHIEQGNLDADYEGYSSNRASKNQLATALVNMRNRMKEIAEQERQRNWVTEGLAKFIDILRSDNSNLDQLYQNIISGLVKYMNANQGGLFLLSDELYEEKHKQLELVACYAYDKKKFLEKKIPVFEGVTGQCFMEEETVFLKNVPHDYINISSGTGEALPRNVILVPLKADKQVLGVIEIASFFEIEVYQRELLEKLAENIAATVANVKTATNMQKLLSELKQSSDKMKEKEEQIREQLAESNEIKSNLQAREDVLNNMMILSESDEFGNITFVNKVLCEISKYTERELLGKPHNIFRHPDVPKEIFKLLWDTVKAGKIFRGIVKNKAKDGETYWVDAVISPVFDENGKIYKYVSARYPITNHEFAEKLYQQQLIDLGLA